MMTLSAIHLLFNTHVAMKSKEIWHISEAIMNSSVIQQICCNLQNISDTFFSKGSLYFLSTKVAKTNDFDIAQKRSVYRAGE